MIPDCTMKWISDSCHHHLFFPLCLEADAAEKLVLVPGSGQIINKDNLIKYVLDLFVWFHFVLRQYDIECDLCFPLLCRFENTPLATPNGDLLIRNLTFEVKCTLHYLISIEY